MSTLGLPSEDRLDAEHAIFRAFSALIVYDAKPGVIEECVRLMVV